jgi:hypothetical protein
MKRVLPVQSHAEHAEDQCTRHAVIHRPTSDLVGMQIHSISHTSYSGVVFGQRRRAVVISQHTLQHCDRRSQIATIHLAEDDGFPQMTISPHNGEMPDQTGKFARQLNKLAIRNQILATLT